MYTYKKEELSPRFHDAVLMCELMGMQCTSLYMDSKGELTISFEGTLSEEQIRNAQMHFLDIVYDDTNISIVMLPT